MDDCELLVEYLRTHSANCPRCGYDLRGIQDCKCPECGQHVAMRVGIAGVGLHQRNIIDQQRRSSFVFSVVGLCFPLVYFFLYFLIAMIGGNLPWQQSFVAFGAHAIAIAMLFRHKGWFFRRGAVVRRPIASACWYWVLLVFYIYVLPTLGFIFVFLFP
jgi:hypothetical protein